MPQIYVDCIKNLLKQSKIICISKCFTKYVKDSQWWVFLWPYLEMQSYIADSLSKQNKWVLLAPTQKYKRNVEKFLSQEKKKNNSRCFMFLFMLCTGFESQ